MSDATAECELAEGWSKDELQIALDAANYAIFMDNEKLAGLVMEHIMSILAPSGK